MHKFTQAPASISKPPINLIYLVILCSIVVCLGPNKMLPFLLPLFLLVPLLMTKGSNLERLIGIFTIFLIQLAFGVLTNPDFRQVNIFISFLTFSSLYLLIMNFSGLRWAISSKLLANAMFKIMIFESLIGIVQGLYGYFETGSFAGSTGDRVAGTVKLSLNSDGSFSNAIFSIIITSMLILLAPYILKNKKRIWLSSLAVLAIILSSVMHVIIFASLAVIISMAILSRFRMVFSAKFIFAGVVMTSAVIFTVGDNLALAQTYIERARDTSLSPRSAMISRVRNELAPTSSPEFFIGSGSGQFISRAGLISSGYYFGGFTSPDPIPYIDTGMTKVQSKYLYDLWYWAATTPWYGSADMPYFSWLAIYTESGVIGIIFCLLVISLLIESISRSQKLDQKISRLSFILFLILLGFSENYFELPQAILPGILLFKLMNQEEASTQQGDCGREV